MAIQSWEAEAQKCRDILEKSIPKQWLAPADKLPPADQLNVVDFPRQSGLLSEEELRITESSATALVAEMGQGKLTAEAVVTAFLKRATLGQQLVCADSSNHIYIRSVS
jgi:amidase